jgi:hypothetical protein
MVPPFSVTTGNYKANGLTIGFLSNPDQLDRFRDGGIAGCSEAAK